jgi:hypothetical protein
MVESETPPIPPTMPELQAEMAELREELKKLRSAASEKSDDSAARHATINPLAKLVDKPAHFKGTAKEREERVIDLFFDLLENYFQAGEITMDADKLLILKARLAEQAAKDYSAHTQSVGRFATYDEAKNWLMAHYTPGGPF